MKIISKEEYEHACKRCKRVKRLIPRMCQGAKMRERRKLLRATFKAQSAIKRAYRRQESGQGVADRARFLRNRHPCQRYSHYWRAMDRIVEAEHPRACALWERSKWRTFPSCYLMQGIAWVLDAKVLPKW